jgi:hypothetical protein
VTCNERDAAVSRILDQPFIFIRELLVDLASNVRGRRLRPASFGLLPKEEIIDVHFSLSALDPPCPGETLAPARERQMTKSLRGD